MKIKRINKNLIRDLIKEELSIAKAVESKSKIVKVEILNDMPSKEWINYNHFSDVKLKHGIVSTDVFKDLDLNIFTIQYFCFAFKNVETYKKNILAIKMTSGMPAVK